MLLMYAGLYYMTGEDEGHLGAASGLDWLCMPFVVLPSLAFFLQWLAKIRTGLLIIAFNSNKGLFKLLTLNLVDANEFFRVHIQHTHTHHGGHHQRGQAGDTDEGASGHSEASTPGGVELEISTHEAPAARGGGE